MYKNRFFKKFVSGVAISLCLLMTFADPASAGSVTLPSPPGGGNGQQEPWGPPANNGGGGGGRGGTFCWEGKGVYDKNRNGRVDFPGDVVIYDPYPYCNSNLPPSQNIVDCTMNFEVWRFYGTRNNPVQFTSVSQAWLPNTCFNDQVLRFYLPDPHDDYALGLNAAQDPLAQGRVRPWAPDVYNSPSSNMPVYLQDGGGFTTSSLFRRVDSGAECSRLPFYNADFLNKFYTGPEANTATGQRIRAKVKSLYNLALPIEGNDPARARARVNLRSINPDVYNDGIQCSSDLDFVAVTDQGTPIAADAQPVFGACAIPVKYQGRVFGNSVFSPIWDRGYFYGENIGGIQPGDQRPAADGAYRAAINREVGSRPGTPKRTNAGGATPAGSPGYGLPAWDFASRYANCYQGGEFVDLQPDRCARYCSPEDVPINSNIRVNVNVPEVAQVGGTLRPSTVSTSSQGLACAPSCAIEDARHDLVPGSVRLNYRLIPVASLNACPGSNCDYDVTSFGQDGAGNGSQTQYFYRSTIAGEEFVVEVTGTAQVQVSALDPLTGEWSVLGNLDIPVNISYPNGNSFPVVGSTNTPVDVR